MAKETYFFSHDCNARNDERILMLRADHGMEGYGIYWALIEMMFESSDTALYHDKIKGIAISCGIVITVLQDTINTAITEKLFESDGIMFWSESLRRRKEKYHSMIVGRSLGGKKAMENRWKNHVETTESYNSVISELQLSNNEVITPDNKGKEIRRKEKDIVILTEQQSKFVDILKSIENYNLDMKLDLEMHKRLETKFPSLDLIKVVESYGIYKMDKPLKSNNNARSQINTACENSMKWNKHTKTNLYSPEIVKSKRPILEGY